MVGYHRLQLDMKDWASLSGCDQGYAWLLSVNLIIGSEVIKS